MCGNNSLNSLCKGVEISNTPGLQKDIEFKTALHDLCLGHLDCSKELLDILDILGPGQLT